jgi:penicillin-binding protein 1A
MTPWLARLTAWRGRWVTIMVVVAGALACGAWGGMALLGLRVCYQVFYNHDGLPDPGPLERFEFPAIGRILDTNGQPLIELAREYRQITPFDEIPAVVRDAIVAAEDKRFFSHDGVDFRSMPRVVGKVRAGAWAARLATGGRRDNTAGRAIFPQGGSTITQQLVRGVFLRNQTSQENSYELRSHGVVSRLTSSLIGARNTNMVTRKREEMRLALWLEREMTAHFGSKRRAKEAILARYASFVYMGNGQYGFARAAEYYLGRPLSSLTSADADKAALLASIAKSPRNYAPTARDQAAVLRRRNQTLGLMAVSGFLSEAQLAGAVRQSLPDGRREPEAPFVASAVVEHVLSELRTLHTGLGLDDLLKGRLQAYTTVDLRIQRIVSRALELGLERYEHRHPASRGLVQGSVVVLRNKDGGVLAESGGRQTYLGRASAYSDFNRVTRSLRQPGSAMKPIVYLAAFRRGDFTLETLVPDEPIAVSTGASTPPKWIANYDGQFKGLIPVRQALAESRNAVAIWIASRIGIDAVLRTSRSLGIETPLRRYPTTALGASEVNLLELATAYRTIASGIVARPHLIERLLIDGHAERRASGSTTHSAPTAVSMV